MCNFGTECLILRVRNLLVLQIFVLRFPPSQFKSPTFCSPSLPFLTSCTLSCFLPPLFLLLFAHSISLSLSLTSFVFCRDADSAADSDADNAAAAFGRVAVRCATLPGLLLPLSSFSVSNFVCFFSGRRQCRRQRRRQHSCSIRTL